MIDSVTRSDLMGIIEKALEDFSEIQINLKSKAARDAIALRIASDISALNDASDKTDADQYFKELHTKIYR